MELVHDVFECEKCRTVFEWPEPGKEEKPSCTSCGSENVKKLFSFNKCKPSAFS